MEKELPIVPTVASAILGLVWLVMTIKGNPPPPPLLTQAIVASLGSISATQILKGNKNAKD